LGLADLNEQKNISLYQILIYVALFLISGYMSYRYMIVPEVKKLNSAHAENAKQKKLLKELEDSTREIEVLANNAQKLEAELVALRSQVFSEDNDVLNFMRSLSGTTAQTKNRLMSIVPMEVKVIGTSPDPNNPQAPNTQATQSPDAKAGTAPPPPTTLPYKLKPIEITFDGGYTDMINFFRQLDANKQYMTVSNMSIGGSQNDPAIVNVKTVLNLVQLGIEMKNPRIDVAKLQQNVPLQQPAVQAKNVVPAQANKGVPTTPPQTLSQQPTVAQKPAVTNVASSKTVSSSQQPVRNVPVSAPVATKPASAPPNIAQSNKPAVVQTKPAEKLPAKTDSAVQPQKVTQPVKQVASAPKPETKATKPDTIAKKTTEIPAKTDQSANGKSGKYAVRVGKFDYYENAQKLLNILKSHGYSGWVKTYSHKGKKTYWVYVGSFDTKDKAEAFAVSMQKELSYIDDYVIMGIKNGGHNNS